MMHDVIMHETGKNLLCPFLMEKIMHQEKPKETGPHTRNEHEIGV
jgi:hypothetical protein